MKSELKQIVAYFCIFLAIRIFSFYFTPPTPLLPGHPLNSILSGAILALAIILVWRKNNVGWIIIAAEIILGGSGGYFSIGPIALRTALMVFSLLIYFGQNIAEQKISFFKSLAKNRFTTALIVLMLWSIVSALIGLHNGHSLALILADLIPYFFLLYYFPLVDLFKIEKFRSHLYLMAIVAIAGNAIFILLVFTGFSSHFFAIQGDFYHWFRDVALGKITDFQNGFFRITLNEHLLLVPAVLFALYKIIFEQQFKQTKIYYFLLASLLTILSVNLTRIYLLALVFGGLILIKKNFFKRSIVTLAATACAFLALFSGLYQISTQFSAGSGLELLGLRLASIAQPQIEESSLSRMLLLPEILKKISLAPIFGSGLGDKIAVFSPVLNQTINTPHFDWGYLEIFSENGLTGLILWLFFLSMILLKIKKSAFEKSLFYSLMAAILIINITSPALFHVLGVILLITVAATVNRASAGQYPVTPHNHEPI